MSKFCRNPKESKKVAAPSQHSGHVCRVNFQTFFCLSTNTFFLKSIFNQQQHDDFLLDVLVLSNSKSWNPQRCWPLSASHDGWITNIPSRNHRGSWDTGWQFHKGYVSSRVRQHLNQTLFFSNSVAGQQIAPCRAKGANQTLCNARGNVFRILGALELKAMTLSFLTGS